MRILMVHNDYARFSGEEHAVESIARLLTQHGHRVDWLRRSSADIRSVRDRAKAFFSGIHSPGSVRAMRRLLWQEQYDVVQVQNLYPLISPSVVPVCRQAAVPVVMRCPNYRLWCPIGLHVTRGRLCERCRDSNESWCLLLNCAEDHLKSLGYALRNTVTRWRGSLLNHVDIFVVLSQFARRRFIESGIAADRIAILPNAAEPRGESCEPGTGECIGYAGRATSEKGIPEFIAAARRMPNVLFEVAGRHDTISELVAQSPPNLHWHGFLEGDELDRFFRRVRILVCPSRCLEGFPNVVARAMLLGKPVVASAVGALPEIIEQDITGNLVSPGNIEELVQRLDDLWNDPEACRRLGQAGHAKASGDYSPDAIYNKLMQIYEQARDAAGRRG